MNRGLLPPTIRVVYQVVVHEGEVMEHLYAKGGRDGMLYRIAVYIA
jgi:hypothetical protein